MNFGKIAFIKFLREMTGWSLKEAKDVLDSIWPRGHDFNEPRNIIDEAPEILGKALGIPVERAAELVVAYKTQDLGRVQRFALAYRSGALNIEIGRVPPSRYLPFLNDAHRGLIEAYRGSKAPREIAQEAIAHAKAMAEAYHADEADYQKALNEALKKEQNAYDTKKEFARG